MIDIHSFYKPFLLRFRKKRMKVFSDLLKPTRATTILDVGGSLFNWFLLKDRPKITVLNIKPPDDLQAYKENNIRFVLGNGLDLPFEDKSFDIVYSNSVIEHLGTFEDQKKFAKEILRVGKNIFVQTPNKYFFIEPHLLTPLIHYLPKKVQGKLLRNFTIWGLLTRPTQQYCNEHITNEIRLLCRSELKLLFPEHTIIRENCLFFAKSFYVIS